MRRQTRGVLGIVCLIGISLSGNPGLTQMRGPRISNVKNVTRVSNWERRFRLISPGMWEMRISSNDRNPFIFRETDQSKTTIFLKTVQNSQLKAKLDLKNQRIKYIIPGQENDPLLFAIQSFNINGGNC